MNAAEQENDRKIERKTAKDLIIAETEKYASDGLIPENVYDFYPELIARDLNSNIYEDQYYYPHYSDPAPPLLEKILKLCPETVMATVKQQDNSTAEKPSPYYEIDYPQDLKSLAEFIELLNKVRRDDLENKTDKTALTVAELHRLQAIFRHGLYPNIFQALINSANKHAKMDGNILYNHFKGVIDNLSPQDVSGDKKD